MTTAEQARRLTPEERMGKVREMMKEIWKKVVAQTKDWDDKEVPQMPVYTHSEDDKLHMEVYFNDSECARINMELCADDEVCVNAQLSEAVRTNLFKGGEQWNGWTVEKNQVDSDDIYMCYPGILRVENILSKVEKLVFDEDKAKGMKAVYLATFNDVPLDEVKKQVIDGFLKR